MAPPAIPPPVPNGVASALTASFFAVVLLLCLLCYFYFRRFKVEVERIEEHDGKYYLVRGAMQLGRIEDGLPSTSVPPPFGRAGITPSIVMPEKSLTRKTNPRSLPDRVLVSPLRRLNPSPLSLQRPRSKALSRQRLSILNPACSRHSRSSSGFSNYISSPPSPGLAEGDRLSPVHSILSSHPKPVHQLFEPALPDELPITRYGEGLVVFQSFSDGWCLVCRDMSPSRLSQFLDNADRVGVDIGIVPAWVFDEPVEGNPVTRPFRTASVNVFGFAQNLSRDGIVSWSHFG